MGLSRTFQPGFNNVSIISTQFSCQVVELQRLRSHGGRRAHNESFGRGTFQRRWKKFLFCLLQMGKKTWQKSRVLGGETCPVEKSFNLKPNLQGLSTSPGKTNKNSAQMLEDGGRMVITKHHPAENFLRKPPDATCGFWSIDPSTPRINSVRASWSSWRTSHWKRRRGDELTNRQSDLRFQSICHVVCSNIFKYLQMWVEDKHLFWCPHILMTDPDQDILAKQEKDLWRRGQAAMDGVFPAVVFVIHCFGFCKLKVYVGEIQKLSCSCPWLIRELSPFERQA